MTSNPSNETQSPSWAALSRHLQRPAIFLLILASLTFVVYYSALSFQFVWDDLPQILNNPLIRSWHSVPRAFTSDLWFHTDRGQIYYRPLFVVWSILNYSVFGLKTWGWHLGAVLLHMIAACVVYLLVRKLGMEHWTAALAGLIFALHPVHIECASWVSAASDTMVTIFYMLAFIAFLQSRSSKQNKIGWTAISLLLLACALLTKEMAVTFALVIAAYVWLFPPETLARARWRKIGNAALAALPYVALTVVYVIARKIALHRTPAQFDPFHSDIDVLLTLPLVLANYLRILSWPVGLTSLYYTSYIESLGFRNFFLPLLLLVAFAGLISYWARRTGDRVVSLAGLWTIVTLIPVLYLRAFGNGDFVRDRYVYLPSVGFIILTAKAIRLLPNLGSLSARTAQVAASVALAIALAVGCLLQQVYWANELLVFYRAYSLYPKNMEAIVGLGASLLNEGGAPDRAISLLREAIREHPDFAPAYFSLAKAYVYVGRKADAEKALMMGLRWAPQGFKSVGGRADLAGLLGEVGDYDHAVIACSQVLREEPNLYSALYNCGNIDFMTGHYVEAEQVLTHAIQIAPDQGAPNYYLGRSFLETGEPVKAEFHLRKAVALDPNIVDNHFWLGRVLEQNGDLNGARREYLQVLKLNPDHVGAKTRLAAVQANQPPIGAGR
ncbi:MAG TPA: tetratricopeptide repeat protein [Terriglobales bacterium]|nr:tetratricopeptide repeat protein [Terriglobales bacterium]